MQKVFATVVGIAVFATASTMINKIQPDANVAKVTRAADAAYRDGLFLGQLDAKRGRAAHIAVGRWSSLAKRELFKEGYQAGYGSLGDSNQSTE